MKALQHEKPPVSPLSTDGCPEWTELSFAAGPAIS